MTNLPYPKPVSPTSTKKMRANRRTDTKPEVEIRSLLHRSGLRFRKDYPIRLSNGKTIRADIAFTKKKIAVFVDGCFWHSCPQHGTVPKSNRDYWIPKLRENVERDDTNKAELEKEGWQVIRIWEHTKSDQAASVIVDAIIR